MEEAEALWKDLTSVLDLPTIPEYVRTKHGQIIHTDGSKWHLPSLHRGANYIVDWSRMEELEGEIALSNRARHLLKLFLANMISKR